MFQVPNLHLVMQLLKTGRANLLPVQFSSTVLKAEIRGSTGSKFYWLLPEKKETEYLLVQASCWFTGQNGGRK